MKTSEHVPLGPAGAVRGRALAPWLLLGAGLPLALATVALPERPALLLRLGLVLCGVAGVAAGIVLHRPPGSRPWVLVLLGMAMSAAGDVTVLVASRGAPVTTNVPADAWLTAVGGVLLLGGIVDATRRVRGSDTGGTLDALIVALAAGTLLWQLIVVAAAAPGWSGSGTEVAGSLQVVFLVAVLVLLVRTGRALPAHARPVAGLLLLAIVTAIAAFLLGAVRGASGATNHYAGWRAGLGATANLAAGAAALHPGMRALTERGRHLTDRLTGWRTTLLGLALLVPPAVLLAAVWQDAEVSLLSLCAAWIALVFAVLGRIRLLWRGRDEAWRRASSSEQRLASLVAHTSDLLLLVRLDDVATTTYASPGARRILGREPEDLLGRPPWDLIAPVDADVLRDLVAGSGGFPRRADVRAVHAEGRTCWLEVVVDDYRDDGGPVLVVTMSDVTDRKHAEMQWAEAALRDPLTGLLNRRGIEEAFGARASAARDHGRVMALALCDLDGLKETNDRHGHAVGDEVLRQAAARLGGSVRSGDLAGRLGGDEFVVVCDLADPATLELVVERFLQALREPVIVGGQEVSVGASAGLAVAAEPDTSLAHLLREADAALYGAKRTGRGKAMWVQELPLPGPDAPVGVGRAAATPADQAGRAAPTP